MIETRSYGTSGPLVLALHGGPGAPGQLAPLARRLARRCRVLEPFQRGSGSQRLTVATHVADLHELIVSSRERCVCLVGASWGAMLALAYAAEHPQLVSSLVLIGCGTFTEASRAHFRANLVSRTGPDLGTRMRVLDDEIEDADERLARKAELLYPVYSYDAIAVAEAELDFFRVDARANRETWDDMLALQAAGIYPRAFRRIASPVLMVHGADDPHPGAEIRDSLAPFLVDLRYVELPACGHYPWLERAARDDFFEILDDWIDRRAT